MEMDDIACFKKLENGDPKLKVDVALEKIEELQKELKSFQEKVITRLNELQNWISNGEHYRRLLADTVDRIELRIEEMNFH